MSLIRTNLHFTKVTDKPFKCLTSYYKKFHVLSRNRTPFKKRGSLNLSGIFPANEKRVTDFELNASCKGSV